MLIVLRLLLLQQGAVSFLVFGFRFVEEQLGEDALVGEVQYLRPFANIAPGKRIYGVDVFKLIEGLYARPFFENGSRRCQQLVFGFDKLG